MKGMSTDIDEVRARARDASVRGDAVFTPTFRANPMKTDGSDGFGQLIAAVEGEGWKLQHWALAGSPTIVACPVFRRV